MALLTIRECRGDNGGSRLMFTWLESNWSIAAANDAEASYHHLTLPQLTYLYNISSTGSNLSLVESNAY